MASQKHLDTLSRVEAIAVARSGQALLYAPAAPLRVNNTLRERTPPRFHNFSRLRTPPRIHKIFRKRSGDGGSGDGEKIKTIVVDNFPALGKLATLRFLEWVQANPEGVIALPTGKTPEYFIKYVTYFLAHWQQKPVQQELGDGGVDPAKKPDLRGLHFVQIDEFYPINPQQTNSFYHYVNHFYLSGFGLERAKALLIDCSEIGLPAGQTLEEVWPDNRVDLSLRTRRAKNNLEQVQKRVLENVDQFCTEYENRIRGLGGIGFFLGGIGPDGHIGFNVMGSDYHSTTRLTPTNYETQAAAAIDLGGIEVLRHRLVITIGLQTIRYNPECVAIIIAAGGAKAPVVADAIQQNRDNRYPATALQDLPNARFYVTSGAAALLAERQLSLLRASDQVTDEQMERIVIDLALSLHKKLKDLTESDFAANRFAAALLQKRPEKCRELALLVESRLIERIQRGATTRTSQIFLHTEPHHDDLLLGYLPAIVRHIRDAANTHYFATLTSGFTAVTNACMLRHLRNLKHFLDRGSFATMVEEEYFKPSNILGRNRDIWQYLDGIAANDPVKKEEGEARRLLRHLVEVFEESNLENLKNRIDELISYFETQYPGKKDLPYIQQLKGMMREWEADCLWGYFGFDAASVMHVRLGFYKGEIFTEEPTVERDVRPILQMLKQTKPTIVSTTLDPEGSGPDTHYKVMQALTEALKQYEQQEDRHDIEVWGYRNVWYRFHPAEANIYVPVSLNMFSILDNAFKNAFISQKDASFPSYEYDGPFSELAQKIQVEQYAKLKICLGREFFYEHPSPLIRATRGLVFLKNMTLPEFYAHSRELQRRTENV